MPMQIFYDGENEARNPFQLAALSVVFAGALGLSTAGHWLLALVAGVVLVIGVVNWERSARKKRQAGLESSGWAVTLVIVAGVVLPGMFQGAGIAGALASAVVGGVIFYWAGRRDLARK